MTKFPIRSLKRFKRFASRLKLELDLLHSHSLELLAKGHGYSNYKEILDDVMNREIEDFCGCNVDAFPIWEAQINVAFRTEVGPTVDSIKLMDWFAGICGATSDWQS